MGIYTLTTMGAATELLDLPFGVPLADWDDPRMVQVPRGISRHVVRFIRANNQIFAIKEATDRYVQREHTLLQDLADRSVPAVEGFGTVLGRRTDSGEELDGLLITRHLPFSLPYRSLFSGRSLPDLRVRLLDSLAQLFVRLHLAGFYWGDCSLSNTLFRRDAGALAAYLVDAETGELHPQLSDGQRTHDITIATENIAGELFDVQAGGGTPDDLDPIETAMALRPRYELLWAELTRDEVVGRDERYRIDQRVKRLNAMGFDVAELAISSVDGGRKLRFSTHVVEPGHHQRALFRLTGLQVQENQARHLLSDLARFRATWTEGTGVEIPEALAARRWLDEKFYATLAMVPPELRQKLPDAELYHEINEHRWFLSEAQGYDVGRQTAVATYVDSVLSYLPDAKVEILTGGPPTEEFDVISDFA
ncbi:protein of unknown function [Frankineae bacterium MT45]|nr:protein of unknown function [Frankineae bacterium MT45]